MIVRSVCRRRTSSRGVLRRFARDSRPASLRQRGWLEVIPGSTRTSPPFSDPHLLERDLWHLLPRCRIDDRVNLLRAVLGARHVPEDWERPFRPDGFQPRGEGHPVPAQGLIGARIERLPKVSVRTAASHQRPLQVVRRRVSFQGRDTCRTGCRCSTISTPSAPSVTRSRVPSGSSRTIPLHRCSMQAPRRHGPRRSPRGPMLSGPLHTPSHAQIASWMSPWRLAQARKANRQVLDLSPASPKRIHAPYDPGTPGGRMAGRSDFEDYIWSDGKLAPSVRHVHDAL